MIFIYYYRFTFLLKTSKLHDVPMAQWKSLSKGNEFEFADAPYFAWRQHREKIQENRLANGLLLHSESYAGLLLPAAIKLSKNPGDSLRLLSLRDSMIYLFSATNQWSESNQYHYWSKK